MKSLSHVPTQLLLDELTRREAHPRILDAVRACAIVFKVKRKAILGRGRRPAVVLARQAAWAVLQTAGFSTADLGRAFARDQTTVEQVLAIVTDQLDMDPAFRARMDRILAILNPPPGTTDTITL
jgi:chromosomal replication initiation ATPase DnaA